MKIKNMMSLFALIFLCQSIAATTVYIENKSSRAIRARPVFGKTPTVAQTIETNSSATWDKGLHRLNKVIWKVDNICFVVDVAAKENALARMHYMGIVIYDNGHYSINVGSRDGERQVDSTAIVGGNC